MDSEQNVRQVSDCVEQIFKFAYAIALNRDPSRTDKPFLRAALRQSAWTFNGQDSQQEEFLNRHLTSFASKYPCWLDEELRGRRS